jgi:hypothetical protein
MSHPELNGTCGWWHLPHGSGIFPVARDTDDEWPFWYSVEHEGER